MENSTIVVGNLNIWLPIVDRKNHDKINKNTEYLANRIDQLDLTGINKILQTTAEYFSFKLHMEHSPG